MWCFFSLGPCISFHGSPGLPGNPGSSGLAGVPGTRATRSLTYVAEMSTLILDYFLDFVLFTLYK